MFTIYGANGCDLCDRIQKVCENFNLTYVFKNIGEETNYLELKEKTQGRIEIPAIFKDETYIGWYTDFIQHLDELEKGE